MQDTSDLTVYESADLSGAYGNPKLMARVSQQ